MKHNGHNVISTGLIKNSLHTGERRLLSHNICELPLKIEGTHLEKLIFRLYRELESAGISFKPETYLSNEWGCPNRVPAIGIPFYIADPKLHKLKGHLTRTGVEDDAEMMMLLRHEAGHTFNYAYRLFQKAKWRRIFGDFSLPYKKDYPVLPFSTRFVHHLPVWYAQKHPDEDFAETFAVWLTPKYNWRKQYAGTPALDKLLCVNEFAAAYGKKPPAVNCGKLDTPLEKMAITLGEYLERCQ